MRISTLRYKSQSVQLPLVFRPGGQEVDAGGLEAGMAQHIRQLHDVTAGPVKGRGEQMAKVVGKRPCWPATPAVLHSPFISAQI